MPRSDRSGGFTLVEVLVALSLSGIVVLIANAVLVRTADGADAITAASRAADVDANAERLLRATILRLEVGTHETQTFGGGERAASFASWCDVPGGWQERCTATLAIDQVNGRAVVVLALSTGDVVMVHDRFESAELRYIADAHRGGTWLRSWGEGITAPIAIGLLLSRRTRVDTLILRIGGRG